jgi:hypothetical protein
MEWPGFAYTSQEKEQLESLASGLSGFQYLAFVLLSATFFIGLAALVIVVGALPVATLLDPGFKSGLTFLGCVLGAAVVCLGFGIPATMGLAATTLNLITRPAHPGPLSDEQAAPLYIKLNDQITRMGGLLVVFVVPLVILGSTRLGGHVLELLERAVFVVAPFIWLMTIVRAMAPKRPPSK